MHGRQSIEFSGSVAHTQSLNMGGYDLLDGSPTSADPSRVYDAHYEAFPLRELVATTSPSSVSRSMPI